MTTSSNHSTPRINPIDIWKSPAHFVSFGFGSGLSPIMPGTMGSIAAIPIILLMHYLLTPAHYAVVTAMATLVGIWLCGHTAKALGTHDHGAIVWDEIAGMMVCCFLLPSFPAAILVAFIAFRIFDILKPYPISWLDKNIHGGLGIMIDDIAAGFFAWAVVQLCGWFLG
jgi:phosphatidylglycerophosphatase A